MGSSGGFDESKKQEQHSAEDKMMSVAHWVGVVHVLVDGHRQGVPDHGHNRVQDEREKCVFVQGDPLTTEAPAGGDREHNEHKLKVVHAINLQLVPHNLMVEKVIKQFP